MEQIKELTRHLISSSFKELMSKHPFEKITIKMITDSAHIIRPTFYNHFHDKYELVEWIFENEIILKIKEDIDKGGLDGVKIMMSAISNDIDYYKKLFEVRGQNNFNEIFEEKVKFLIEDIVKNKEINIPGVNISKEDIIILYSMQINSFVRFYIYSNGKIDEENIEKLFAYIMTNSVIEIFT